MECHRCYQWYFGRRDYCYWKSSWSVTVLYYSFKHFLGKGPKTLNIAFYLRRKYISRWERHIELFSSTQQAQYVVLIERIIASSKHFILSSSSIFKSNNTRRYAYKFLGQLHDSAASALTSQQMPGLLEVQVIQTVDPQHLTKSFEVLVLLSLKAGNHSEPSSSQAGMAKNTDSLALPNGLKNTSHGLHTPTLPTSTLMLLPLAQYLIVQQALSSTS